MAIITVFYLSLIPEVRWALGLYLREAGDPHFVQGSEKPYCWFALITGLKGNLDTGQLQFVYENSEVHRFKT